MNTINSINRWDKLVDIIFMNTLWETNGIANYINRENERERKREKERER